MESRGFEFEMVNVDLVPDADTLQAQVSSITGGDGGRFELVWLPPDMINRLHPTPHAANA